MRKTIVLLAAVLAVLGYDVVLLERGTHPRFAIGESSTPLANLSLERIGIRYGLADCYQLATHGRWLEHQLVAPADTWPDARVLGRRDAPKLGGLDAQAGRPRMSEDSGVPAHS